MTRKQGHGAAGRTRIRVGLLRIECTCGWSFEGSRKVVDGRIRQHWDEAYTPRNERGADAPEWPTRRPPVDKYAGAKPETHGKRAVADGAPDALHVMARRRGA